MRGLTVKDREELMAQGRKNRALLTGERIPLKPKEGAKSEYWDPSQKPLLKRENTPEKPLADVKKPPRD